MGKDDTSAVDVTNTETTAAPLTDAQLAEGLPAVAKLVASLEDIARRDPSPGVAGIASALAEYFRTPD